MSRSIDLLYLNYGKKSTHNSKQMITVVSLDRELTFDQVKKSLLELFPDLVIFAEDPETIDPKDINWGRLDHVFLRLESEHRKKDFRYYITIESGSNNDDRRRGQHLARKISEDYGVRCIAGVDITGIDHPDVIENQYNGALFDNGKTYLIDDYFDYPMDDDRPAKGIEIIMEIEIPHYRFDSTGDYLGIVTNENF